MYSCTVWPTEYTAVLYVCQSGSHDRLATWQPALRACVHAADLLGSLTCSPAAAAAAAAAGTPRVNNPYLTPWKGATAPHRSRHCLAKRGLLRHQPGHLRLVRRPVSQVPARSIGGANCTYSTTRNACSLTRGGTLRATCMGHSAGCAGTVHRHTVWGPHTAGHGGVPLAQVMAGGY
jgi:hypothetical protein